MVEKICKNCKYGYMRSSFDISKYGNYGYPLECIKPKTEFTPYRRANDNCEKWEPKDDKERT